MCLLSGPEYLNEVHLSSWSPATLPKCRAAVISDVVSMALHLTNRGVWEAAHFIGENTVTGFQELCPSHTASWSLGPGVALASLDSPSEQEPVL